MIRLLLLVGLLSCFLACSNNDSETPLMNNDDDMGTDDAPNIVGGCPGAPYPNWETSSYVLPYPVGESYQVRLSHCTNSYHAENEPDEYAIDFNMPIGSLIVASRDGEVVHVEENGFDGEFPNNLVVVKHTDNTFAQYMHLTRDGAYVAVGDMVVQGDSIGSSGATGLAGYPHLHFVLTLDTWEYPYTSTWYNFKNTDPNPTSLRSGRYYPALPY